jgi:glycosyltransferase involved in cell wall biosynthesis
VLFVGPYQNIVGEQQYAQGLSPLIEQLGEAWSFLGVLSPAEFAAFFYECEVTVLPSINSTESYGLVQVESMSCGTPVVASDLPGVRVPVKMSGMGRIVPPANAPALAESILAILDNPSAYRGTVENLVHLSSPENVAAEYEAAFEAALSMVKKSGEQEQGLEQKEI